MARTTPSLHCGQLDARHEILGFRNDRTLSGMADDSSRGGESEAREFRWPAFDTGSGHYRGLRLLKAQANKGPAPAHDPKNHDN